MYFVSHGLPGPDYGKPAPKNLIMSVPYCQFGNLRLGGLPPTIKMCVPDTPALLA